METDIISKKPSSLLSSSAPAGPMPFTPREIVSELDRHIVGQKEAKRAVAIALRNRWRRINVAGPIKEEIQPKNILMIGPTGVGKTEVARRLAKLAQAPFLKVEATKFTEVGYVGRDVEQIVRDLMEISLGLTREKLRKEVRHKALAFAEEKILHALLGNEFLEETREKYKDQLHEGTLDDKIVEVMVADNSSAFPTIDIPGMPGAQIGMLNLGDVFGKSFGGNRTKTRKLSVKEGLKLIVDEESDKLLDQEKVIQEAVTNLEQNGIVFIDEFDKICSKSERHGADVSREGVQRDLLPLIEGTTVQTKHGNIKTDHILFIASGAFHVAKPSDLLPELQGRLPIRVELTALNAEDFIRILTEPEGSLIKQYTALLQTEGVTLIFTPEGIREIAHLSAKINEQIENIGARRLHTIMEKLLEDISFRADENAGSTFTLDEAYVVKTVGHLAKTTDLSKFIL